MNAQRILFPTDFSDASHGALKYATVLARDSGATLLILHVEDWIPPLSGEMYMPTKSFSNPELKKLLAKVVPADKQVAYEHLFVVGEPSDSILRIAKEQHVDLIVMGTHGRTGLGRLLMGSVAEAIVRRAECPVLTVKQQAPVEALVEQTT